MKTAQILIIGDEILSGRTQDTNSHFLCHNLFSLGIRVQSIEVIPDNEILLAQWVREKHARADYTFLTGGIGGTPDDVTRSAVARGLGLKLVRHPEAEKLLREFYKDRINNDRLSMSELPEGSQLIRNSVTMAPGIKIKNIYVLAGVPQILHVMFESIREELTGSPLFEEAIQLPVGEGEIARHMKTLNREFPLLELGSYPNFDKSKGYRTQLVFRSENQDVVKNALARFKELHGSH